SYVCTFCEHKQKQKCIICNKKIDQKEDIQVDCEFCGNFMHWECLKIPIHLIYSRKMYSRFFKDEVCINNFINELRDFEKANLKFTSSNNSNNNINNNSSKKELLVK